MESNHVMWMLEGEGGEISRSKWRAECPRGGEGVEVTVQTESPQSNVFLRCANS